MSRFTDYTESAEAGRLTLLWRIELIDPEGALLATDAAEEATGNAVLWGASIRPMALQGNRFSARSSAIRVIDPDCYFMPNTGRGLLHPDTGNRVRISAGITKADGSDVYFIQATMVPLRVTGHLDKSIEVELVDPLRPVDSDLVNTVVIEEGTPIEDGVAQLLADLPITATLAPTGFNLPAGAFEIGEGRRDIVNELLESAGHELTADSAGNIFSREIPPTTDDLTAPRWRYGEGGLPVADARRVWGNLTHQGYRVQSGDFQGGQPSLTKLVFDTDPRSEGFFRGPGDVNCPIIQYAFAQTAPQLAAAGYGQLRRHGVGPCIAEIEIVPNPAMRVGDLMDMSIPELNVSGTFRVLDIPSLPMQVDGVMTVRVRGTYDPALNYDPPIDDNTESGCLTAFNDGYDRPDENLEDLVGSSGSPVYSEVQYSWGVVGGQAIQRYHNGWSLGFVNTPICSTDVRATMTVGSIPSGRRLGPVIRCSGEIDGYAALADSNGRIRLEMWLGRQSQGVLAQHDSGGPIDGKDLEIRALGTTIVVLLDGSTVITVTDDRRTGAYVGMLAYGGEPPNSPSVDEFDVAAI